MPDFTGWNQPASLHKLLEIRRIINEICRDELTDAVDRADLVGTKIAALAYLARRETKLPGVSNDYLEEIEKVRGKTPITKLVNYLIDSVPARNQRIIQEIKNQIVSTVSLLDEMWQPVQMPTFEDTVKQITEIGFTEYDKRGNQRQVKDIHGLHRLWMSILSSKIVAERHRQALAEEALQEKERQERAAALSAELGRTVTTSELTEIEAKQAAEAKEAAETAKWATYVDAGTPVEVAEPGQIYIGAVAGAGVVFVRLSDAPQHGHFQRTRECMLRA